MSWAEVTAPCLSSRGVGLTVMGTLVSVVLATPNRSGAISDEREVQR